jgi:hypothetical protein
MRVFTVSTGIITQHANAAAAAPSTVFSIVVPARFMKEKNADLICWKNIHVRA